MHIPRSSRIRATTAAAPMTMATMTPPEMEPRLSGMKVGRVIGVVDSDAERLGEVESALD